MQAASAPVPRSLPEPRPPTVGASEPDAQRKRGHRTRGKRGGRGRNARPAGRQPAAQFASLPPASDSAALLRAFQQMCAMQCSIMRTQSACLRSICSSLCKRAASQPPPSGAAAVPSAGNEQPVASATSQMPAASAAGTPAVEQHAPLQQRVSQPAGAPVPAGEPADARMETGDTVISREQGAPGPSASGSRPACTDAPVHARVRPAPAGLRPGFLDPLKSAKVVAGSSPRSSQPGT